MPDRSRSSEKVEERSKESFALIVKQHKRIVQKEDTWNETNGVQLLVESFLQYMQKESKANRKKAAGS